MSSLQNYMRQNVDFSVADARIQNPHMQATDVFRRISVAHSLAGGLQLQADDNARRLATSYCGLAGVECVNAGGLYASTGILNPAKPMFATPTSVAPPASGQASPATALTSRAYDMYWRGGARLNIDAVSESRCVIPESYGMTGGNVVAGCDSAVNYAPPVASTDMNCFTACRSNTGQGQACAVLCALQPPNDEDAGPFSIAAPVATPRFDADLPLSVSLDACLRQCTDAPLPGQQQACRLGCISQTGAPSLFNNAAGSCTLACMQTCTATGGAAADCSNRCVNACTGTTRQNPYATPEMAIPIGF